MRNLNDTSGSVLEQDRVVTRQCPGCGADVTVRFDAGMSQALVTLMLRLPATCEPCADAATAADEAEERLERRRERVRASGLPAALHGLEWASYDVSRPGARGALKAAMAWADGTSERKGLLLTGPVGVGKTRLAATASYAAMLRMPLRWVSVPELIISIGAEWKDSARANAIKVLTGAGPLVLDDLDKVTASTWVLSNLFTAVDRRVQSGAPLLVTTNLDPNALVAKFTGTGRDAEERRVAAEALVSRLLGHCELRGIGGTDGRLA